MLFLFLVFCYVARDVCHRYLRVTKHSPFKKAANISFLTIFGNFEHGAGKVLTQDSSNFFIWKAHL